LFLEDDKVEELHDFEEECMDDLSRKKHVERITSKTELIQGTSERTEFISMKVKDLLGRDANTRANMRDVDERLLRIEQTQHELVALLRAAVTPMHAATVHDSAGAQLAHHARQPVHNAHVGSSADGVIKSDLPHVDSRTTIALARRDLKPTLVALGKTALEAQWRRAQRDDSPHQLAAMGMAAVATRAAAEHDSLISPPPSPYIADMSHLHVTPRVQKQRQSRSSAATIPETSESFDNKEDGNDTIASNDVRSDGASLQIQQCMNVPDRRAMLVYASYRRPLTSKLIGEPPSPRFLTQQQSKHSAGSPHLSRSMSMPRSSWHATRRHIMSHVHVKPAPSADGDQADADVQQLIDAESPRSSSERKISWHTNTAASLDVVSSTPRLLLPVSQLTVPQQQMRVSQA
jgi:hypothetical protein